MVFDLETATCTYLVGDDMRIDDSRPLTRYPCVIR